MGVSGRRSDFLPRRIGGMGALWRGRAGTERRRRAADGSHESPGGGSRGVGVFDRVTARGSTPRLLGWPLRCSQRQQVRCHACPLLTRLGKLPAAGSIPAASK